MGKKTGRLTTIKQVEIGKFHFMGSLENAGAVS